jgi:hypothetical protein
LRGLNPLFLDSQEITIKPMRNLAELGDIGHRLDRIATAHVLTNPVDMGLDPIDFGANCFSHLIPIDRK